MLPNLSSVLDGWEEKITLLRITQSIVDFETVESEKAIKFNGIIQPLQPEKLKIKPLELRSYKWLQIHTRKRHILSTNDIIVYDGIRYKVSGGKLDYSLNGFVEYHAVELLNG